MSEAVPTEVWFYHLERQPLETVLPPLVERTLERKWRAVVQAGSQERVEAFDLLLWTFRDDSFIPHGTRRDGHAELQPVFLTTDSSNPNAAVVRFLVDGADLESFEGYARVVYVFDGHDSDAVDRARDAWRRARTAGCQVMYWQQTDQGRWERKG